MSAREDTPRRNRWLVAVLALVVASWCLLEYLARPELNPPSKLQSAELNPASSDIKDLGGFANPYMGDAANDVNLNAHLPLAEYPRTYELRPSVFELDVNFSRSLANTSSKTLKTDLIYDATANFSLIGNLQRVVFHFPDASYRATRGAVQRWYGRPPMELTRPRTWSTTVQRPLRGQAYVDAAFTAIFGAPSARVAAGWEFGRVGPFE